MKSKTIQRLSSKEWYHGTVKAHWKSICEKGIIYNFNNDTSDSLDFGYGFYMTDSLQGAKNFVEKILKFSNASEDDQKIPVILQLEYCPKDEWSLYNCKVFEKYDDEFAEFIFNNRISNLCGCKQHKFDMIYGCMSDSYPTKIILDYKDGVIDKKTAVEQLKKSTSMKQLSLHTQQLCDKLKVIKAYQFDLSNNIRKELDICEYKYNKCNK